jgi:hypothetical protein
MPNKYNGWGSLDHILSSYTASNDALPKWTLAKRKLIIRKRGTPCNIASTHAALISDISHADPVRTSIALPSAYVQGS